MLLHIKIFFQFWVIEILVKISPKSKKIISWFYNKKTKKIQIFVEKKMSWCTCFKEGNDEIHVIEEMIVLPNKIHLHLPISAYRTLVHTYLLAFTWQSYIMYLFTSFVHIKFYKLETFFLTFINCKYEGLKFQVPRMMVIKISLYEPIIGSISDHHYNNSKYGPLDILVEWNGMEQCFLWFSCSFMSQLHIWMNYCFAFWEHSIFLSWCK